MGAGEFADSGNINKEGMTMFGMTYDRNVWKKTFVERIQEYGRRW